MDKTSKERICFVIQPFDNGKFDKRYRDIFKPAIIEAGFFPYRVDEDPTVDVVITAVEGKIAEADVCLAEITTDNPNVWYEVGFANALKKRIVFISCSSEKQNTHFPFDVRHRKIISYQSESPSDHAKLKTEIVTKLKASTRDCPPAATRISQVGGSRRKRRPEPPEVGDLDIYEIEVMRSIIYKVDSPGSSVGYQDIECMLGGDGIAPSLCKIAIKSLYRMNFISENYSSWDIPDYYYTPTDLGWKWAKENIDGFRL